jgi:DNA-binding response OmpR family regulator
MMKILIVEDERKLAQSIFDYLKKEENIDCEIAVTYQEGLRKILDFEYDCIILDITLPDGNGLDILARLKEDKSNTGVLVISARNTTENKIEGLNLGADDYIAKPFHLTEMNARIKSILRRRNFNGETVLDFDQIKIILNDHLVYVNDQLLNLTPKEFSLLMYFISNKNRVVTKESLIDHFWENGYDQTASNDLIYAHIKNLRHKILEKGGKDYIRTVYGIGYKLSNPT